jgi:hypothetical protein
LLDVRDDEAREGLRCGVLDDLGPTSARSDAPNFDCYGHHKCLPPSNLPAAAKSELLATDERLVHLDGALQSLSVGVDHGAAQLVQDQPGGFIPRQPEHVLKLERR